MRCLIHNKVLAVVRCPTFLAIVMTAARLGANVANHVAVTELLKKDDGNNSQKICGAKVKDMITGMDDIFTVIESSNPKFAMSKTVFPLYLLINCDHIKYFKSQTVPNFTLFVKVKFKS